MADHQQLDSGRPLELLIEGQSTPEALAGFEYDGGCWSLRGRSSLRHGAYFRQHIVLRAARVNGVSRIALMRWMFCGATWAGILRSTRGPPDADNTTSPTADPGSLHLDSCHCSCLIHLAPLYLTALMAVALGVQTYMRKLLPPRRRPDSGRYRSHCGYRQTTRRLLALELGDRSSIALKTARSAGDPPRRREPLSSANCSNGSLTIACRYSSPRNQVTRRRRRSRRAISRIAEQKQTDPCGHARDVERDGGPYATLPRGHPQRDRDGPLA